MFTPPHPLHTHKHKQTAPSASPTDINTILNALLILIEPHHNSVCRFFIFPKTKSFPKASCKTANAGEKIYTFCTIANCRLRKKTVGIPHDSTDK